MTEKLEPLTIKEVDDFLAGLDKKRCPWCDGNQWGVHIDKTNDSPNLRGLPQMQISLGDDGLLKAQLHVGANALPIIVAQCNDCGYMYTFNYLSIMAKIRRLESALKGDDVNSGGEQGDQTESPA